MKIYVVINDKAFDEPLASIKLKAFKTAFDAEEHMLELRDINKHHDAGLYRFRICSIELEE